jgi:hypothetical protein
MPKYKCLTNFRNLRKIMKTLININNRVWGKVKAYATVKELSLNLAVEHLLDTALSTLTNESKEKEA